MSTAKFLGLVVLSGCAHVDLAPLPPNATPQQRIEAFRARRPYVQAEELTIYRTGGVTYARSLILADGTKVTHAEDLLPLIPPDGVAARAARKSAAARTKKQLVQTVGFTAVLAGFVWMVSSLSARTAEFEAGGDPDDPIGPLLTVAGGALVTLVGGWYFRGIENDNQQVAFAFYEQELGRQLGICASGMHLVVCEAPAPGPGPRPIPASPRPSLPGGPPGNQVPADPYPSPPGAISPAPSTPLSFTPREPCDSLAASCASGAAWRAW